MEDESQDILTGIETMHYAYGTFWQRTGALLIDSLAMAPLFIVDWFNKTSWKSIVLTVAILLIGLLYKTLLEFKYGATIGKMALKLLVVNKSFQKANFREVLFRNIFEITERVYAGIIELLVFGLPAFQYISSIKEYSQLSASRINAKWFLAFSSIILIAEIILVLTDKQRRSLHDRIGQTFVVKRSTGY